MALARIYTYDSKKDGWKAVPSEKATKNWVILSPKRGKLEFSGPICHYFLRGKSMCAKFPTEPADATFNNTTQAYCDDCLPGVRKMALEAKLLETKGDESKNVVDYKAVEKLDKPETSKVTH